MAARVLDASQLQGAAPEVLIWMRIVAKALRDAACPQGKRLDCKSACVGATTRRFYGRGSIARALTVRGLTAGALSERGETSATCECRLVAAFLGFGSTASGLLDVNGAQSVFLECYMTARTHMDENKLRELHAGRGLTARCCASCGLTGGCSAMWLDCRSV